MADGAIGFHCTACGQCCNSPPAMSVAELFTHRDRFIGSLAVGLVRRVPAGGRIAHGTARRLLDEENAAQLAGLQDALHHPGPGGQLVSLVTQAWDYPSLARCPALGGDGGCAVHGPDKPRMCRVVPLDPGLPDRLQDSVLLNRRAAGGWAAGALAGASCIEPGADAPWQPLVFRGRVADASYREDLGRRRADLLKGKRRWGRAVHGMLARELSGPGAPRLAADGYLALPLAPVLAVLAAEGAAMRAACVDYIDAQLALIDGAITAALARKDAADKAGTAQLRAFALAYGRQRALLA